jgi:hypothetical protein
MSAMSLFSFKWIDPSGAEYIDAPDALSNANIRYSNPFHPGLGKVLLVHMKGQAIKTKGVVQDNNVIALAEEVDLPVGTTIEVQIKVVKNFSLLVI